MKVQIRLKRFYEFSLLRLFGGVSIKGNIELMDSNGRVFAICPFDLHGKMSGPKKPDGDYVKRLEIVYVKEDIG